jgi:hypothetical protein
MTSVTAFALIRRTRGFLHHESAIAALSTLQNHKYAFSLAGLHVFGRRTAMRGCGRLISQRVGRPDTDE